MSRSVRELRSEICNHVGISSVPSGAFRKDDLNVILSHLGGDALDAAAVYGWDAPDKSSLYERVAAEAEFDYEPGKGDNARPFNKGELNLLLAAVQPDPDE